MSFTLDEIARATGGRLSGDGETRLERLVTDSRQAGPGTMFAALRGEAMDGHQFAAAAVRNGATAVLCERATGTGAIELVVSDTRQALADFGRAHLAALGVRVVGVTGSVGKTTTKEMLALVLATRYRVQKTEGNLNTYTGLPASISLLEPGTELFLAEYAMSALREIAELCRIAPPDVALVLNVGRAHVGLLGDIDAVARAKRELVEGLKPGGIAVLNRDDHRVAAMAGSAPGRVIWFGEAAGDVRAEAVRDLGLEGTAFRLVTPDGAAEVRLNAPGAHLVADAVAAAAAGYALDVSVTAAAAALEAFAAVDGRAVVRPGRLGSWIIDDTYNASPESMTASLRLLLRVGGGGARIAVLGDMLELGGHAVAAHREVGAEAASADLLVALGDHAQDILDGARAAGADPRHLALAGSPEAAAAAVEPRLAGATVLVKASRGMALERVVQLLLEDPG